MSAALDNIFMYLMDGLDYEVALNDLADFKKKFLFEGSKTSICIFYYKYKPQAKYPK